jgi:chemotaxis protein CheC
MGDPQAASADPSLLALSAAQEDLLREVATIGAGRAATALAVLTGRRVQVEVPTVHALPLGALAATGGRADDPVVGLRVAVRGDLSGTLLLLLDPAAAATLAAQVLRQSLGAMSLGALEDSALAEVGGITAGAYLAAVGEFVGKVVTHQPPVVQRASRDEVLRAAGPALGRPGAPLPCLGHALTVEDPAAPRAAQVRWLLDPPSLHALLRATGLR